MSDDRDFHLAALCVHLWQPCSLGSRKVDSEATSKAINSFFTAIRVIRDPGLRPNGWQRSAQSNRPSCLCVAGAPGRRKVPLLGSGESM